MGGAGRTRRGRRTAMVVGVALLGIATTATVARAADPEPDVRVSIRVDHPTYQRGEDITGVTTFTNTTGHDVLLTDRNGCLLKWGVVVAPGNRKFERVSTLECRAGLSVPRPRGDYLAFHPGVTRLGFAVASVVNSCSRDPAAVRRGEARCGRRGNLPLFPAGNARVGLVVGAPSSTVQHPPARHIRIAPLGHGPRFCVGGQLRVAERSVRIHGASTVATFTGVNQSDEPCRLDGVPYVFFAGPTGSDSSFDHLRLRAAHPVRLDPGKAASFSATFATRLDCTHPITTARILLPDQGAAGVTIEIPTHANPCAYGGDVAMVTVSPFVAARPATHG